MSFVFMVFHWPEPGRADTLAQSMREMGGALAATPGCVGVEPPYVADDGACLVGFPSGSRGKRSCRPVSRCYRRARLFRVRFPPGSASCSTRQRQLAAWRPRPSSPA